MPACSVCSGDNSGSLNWYSPSRRPLRQPEVPPPPGFSYDNYDYACAYGDRLPAPSPVYSRQGYVRRASPSNQLNSTSGSTTSDPGRTPSNQLSGTDWYARGDGDGRFDPTDRFHDNGLHALDGRSPYRQYEDSVNRARDRTRGVRSYDAGSCCPGGYGAFLNRARDPPKYCDEEQSTESREYGYERWYDEYGEFGNRRRDPLGGYYDDEGQFGGAKASRLSDGLARRNGGIGFDWSAAAGADRKSAYRKLPKPNRKSPDPNRKLSDRKSAYRKLPERNLVDRYTPNDGMSSLKRRSSGRNCRKSFCRKSPNLNRMSPNRKLADRKSAYRKNRPSWTEHR